MPYTKAVEHNDLPLSTAGQLFISIGMDMGNCRKFRFFQFSVFSLRAKMVHIVISMEKLKHIIYALSKPLLGSLARTVMQIRS